MAKSIICTTLAAASLLLTLGCSYVPPLEEAAGAKDVPILISDVVHRVKCEIADSFDEKLRDPRFRWLENWTAKVDLTLQINDSAGLSPSVSYTKFYRNAFNFDAGSNSLTSNVIGAVGQTLTITGGVNFSEQAQRAETITFTVSLREIRNWNRAARTYISLHYGPEAAEQFCKSSERELRGYLGLEEWIDSALFPVAEGQLQAGIHPQPGGGASKPPSPGPKGAKLEIFKPVDIKLARIEAHKALDAAQDANKTAIDAQKAIDTSISNVRSAMEVSIGPFLPILTRELKAILASNQVTLAAIQEVIKTDVDNAADALREAQALANKVDAWPNDTIGQDVIDDAQRIKIDADKFAKDAEKQQSAAKKIEDNIVNFKPNPPIDGLLHSVQFIVGYGASINPNWALLVWKGPGVNAPTALTSGMRTNILNIALGSPSEQNRLIQNITVSNAGVHP